MKYVRAPKSYWREVYISLKDEGYSLRRIKDELGVDLRNQLYRGVGLDVERMEALGVVALPNYEDYVYERSKPVNCEFNADFAEIIGIVLGDGYLHPHYLSICLDAKYMSYIEYVKNLFHKVFDIELRASKVKGAYLLRTGCRNIISELTNAGLKIGKKSGRDVRVPNWIMETMEYQLRCGRGLFDTDGSIYLKGPYKYVTINFSSRSKGLRYFVKKLCENLEVSCYSNDRGVTISSRESVTRLLIMMEPFRLLEVLRGFPPQISHELKIKNI